MNYALCFPVWHPLPASPINRQPPGLPRRRQLLALAVATIAMVSLIAHATTPASAEDGFGETIVESAVLQSPLDGTSDDTPDPVPGTDGNQQQAVKSAAAALIRKPVFWSPYCSAAAEGRQQCHIEHAVRDKRQRQLVRFAVAEVNGARRLVVFAPIGLSIPYGVHIRIDKLPTRQLRLETCDRRSCEANVDVDPVLSQQMAAGARIAVLLKDGQSGRPISVAGSLHGFTAAFRQAFGGSP